MDMIKVKIKGVNRKVINERTKYYCPCCGLSKSGNKTMLSDDKTMFGEKCANSGKYFRA